MVNSSIVSDNKKLLNDKKNREKYLMKKTEVENKILLYESKTKELIDEMNNKEEIAITNRISAKEINIKTLTSKYLELIKKFNISTRNEIKSILDEILNEIDLIEINTLKAKNIESLRKKENEIYLEEKNKISEEIINKNKNCKKEINEAQNTIKILDKKINELKEKINMNYSFNNLFRYQDKIKEVKIWRETFYEEFFKYKNLLKDLKNNLNKLLKE